MPNDGFTIRIYVPDGDPDGVRFIDRMASTGRAISFPRAQWPRIRSRPEFERAGVYITKQIDPIPFANAPAGSMQGPRYTHLCPADGRKEDRGLVPEGLITKLRASSGRGRGRTGLCRHVPS
jgi:hypothetical protein